MSYCSYKPYAALKADVNDRLLREFRRKRAMTIIDGGRPRYQLLAARLREEIEMGRYPVGSLMPTEREISSQYNVSRSTVREAIRRLQAAGLVSRRAGVGTRIESSAPVATYSQLGSSIQELVESGKEIRMNVTKSEDVIADDTLADILRCKPGQQFLRLEGVVWPTRPRSSKHPFYWVEIYVPPAYAGIRNRVARHDGLIASLIEQSYGEPIVEIKQEVTATLTGTKIGRVLSVPKGTPALRFQRWYYGNNSSLMQITISVRPAGRFSYCSQIRRSAL
jgi:DNA-binding GntR family transcriptional regulator